MEFSDWPLNKRKAPQIKSLMTAGPLPLEVSVASKKHSENIKYKKKYTHSS